LNELVFRNVIYFEIVWVGTAESKRAVLGFHFWAFWVQLLNCEEILDWMARKAIFIKFESCEVFVNLILSITVFEFTPKFSAFNFTNLFEI
jgi:hypothetical protein